MLLFLSRDADSAIVETSRSNTLAVRNMPYAAFLSKLGAVNSAYDCV